MKPVSYWLDSAPAFSSATLGPPQGRTDVAVIGGGFTGLTAALSLARAGASVTLLEAGPVVGEASGRNGGQCNNGTLQDFAGLTRSLGVEKASDYYRAYNQAVDMVEALAQSEAIDCDFKRSGKLKIAAKPGHYDNLQRTCAALQSAGVDPEAMVLDKAALAPEINSDAYYGGLLQPRSAQLHVGKFGIGLAERAAAAGARIYESSPATQLDREASGEWRVATPHGEVQASQVLLATGGGGPGPFGWFRRRIVPVGSFIVVTEPLGTERLDALLPGRRSYVNTLNIGNYFRRTPDERLLFGGRARFAVSNPRSDAKSGVVLQKTLANTFPVLADARIDYCWGGTVDMSADRLPRAGERNGLFYSMGYSGHGVQMAVMMGQVMAKMLQGQSSGNPWAGLPWPAVPGHFGKPWFLPMVGLYYRMLDYLH